MDVICIFQFHWPGLSIDRNGGCGSAGVGAGWHDMKFGVRGGGW